MSRTSLALAAVLVLGLAAPAAAATLTIVGAPNDGTTITMPEATITAAPGTALMSGNFTVSNAVCALASDGCNGIFTLDFNFDVTDVGFEFGIGNPGDSALLTMFDSGGNLIGTDTLDLVSGTDFHSLASFGTLRSIVFDTSASTGAGYAYGNISFDPAVATVVPLPAGFALLLTGLGVLGLLRRKRPA